MGFIVEVLVKEQITQYLNIQTLTHQTNHQQYLTLNTQHIGTIDLSSTVIYFITDNNVPYCCTPIKLYTPRKLTQLVNFYCSHRFTFFHGFIFSSSSEKRCTSNINSNLEYS